ncbi:hypothetical protein [Cohnella sp. GCM10027633]|uniref:hypothetical protein n=1 Tax=unclassified Cohnella TaxID=2636738 RepID=UPI0036313EE3
MADAEEKFSEAEEQLARMLTEGEQEAEAPEVEAARAISPKWEIRVQAERDPVAEETKLYRKLASEVDGRYDDR